eukprot:CAMPEP_0171462240 /NCGR_PEP_ID=MMETSP0945-20130129/6355_1 /TAXON_ID=109269 /ORGANISM="Vaucheria litorea, Strain CCMP2940" /LENGTH=696 /DNA_ID=CAMNT_0011988723 /DNA_START=203 /DNA_END=2293 /DNA_ORIENTATION=+
MSTQQETKEEKFEFQAEVSRVMDIIINSLYSNRDVFLRELISNAADACDKKRFLSLTSEKGVSDSDAEGKIRVKMDKEKRILTIQDSGIGMSKDELINNLGRIAQSGTAKFMEALGKGQDDINLIGQFGVGFYSGFLVADKMSVVSKSWKGDDADTKQYRWESTADSTFTIKEDDGEPIEGSGTRIELHIKDDCDEYLEAYKIKELCQKYSEFVAFPIEVWSEKTKYEQVPDPEKEAKEGEDPPMKSVSKTSFEWETMNKMKPIWMRNPKEITEEEYSEFYKTTFKAWDEPMGHTHFSLEGQVEFKALLYIPGMLPYELSRNMFDETSRNMRLYVKRIFINDKFEELLPRWLMFMRGLVDSEDLPLNVGREILQKSKMLSVINKRLVRKSIDLFQSISEDKEKFNKFNESFGKYLKVGIIEDDDSKPALAKLVTFTSTHDEGKEQIWLSSYVSRMKENQKGIYYICADSKSSALMSPALEKARKLGYEVIFMIEPLEELCAQAIERFEDKPLIDLSKENADLGDDNEVKEKAMKSEETEEFREWIKKLIENKVSKVEVSTRLIGSPATIVQTAYGMSPTMQRYMRAQAISSMKDSSGMFDGMNQAVLEINLSHPIIKRLEMLFDTSPEGEDAKALAMLLYDVAALTGGYNIDDAAMFAKRVTDLMMKEGGIEPEDSDKERGKKGGKEESVNAEIVE